MIPFFKFLLETLTDVEKAEVSRWEGQTDAAKEYSDHFFGRGVETHEEPLKVTPNKSAIHKSLEDYLGKEISIEDYRAGVIQRGDKQNPMRIGKIKDLPSHILKAFSEDTTRSLKTQKSSEFTVHTTRSKEGVASQTTNNCTWTGSCKRYGAGGAGARYLPNEVKHGTVVSYLRNAQGKDIARTTYHPYTNSNGDSIYKINAHYGSTTPDYLAHTKDIEDRLSRPLPVGHDINFSLNKYNFYNDGKPQTVTHSKINKEYIDDVFNNEPASMSHENLGKFYQHMLGENSLYPKTITANHINKFLSRDSNLIDWSTEENETRNQRTLRHHITKTMLNNSHPGINENHLDRLMSHPDKEIRLAALGHPNISKKSIDNAILDEDEDVQKEAVKQSRFLPREMHQFIDYAKTHNPALLEPISKHPDLGGEHVKSLLDVIRNYKPVGREVDGSHAKMDLVHHNMLKSLIINHPEHIDKDSVTIALNSPMDENHNMARHVALQSGVLNLTREHVNALLTKRHNVVTALADNQYTGNDFSRSHEDKLHLTEDDLLHHMTTPLKHHYLDESDNHKYVDRSWFFRGLMKHPIYKPMIDKIISNHPKFADDAAMAVAKKGTSDNLHYLASSPHTLNTDILAAIANRANDHPDSKNSIKMLLLQRPDVDTHSAIDLDFVKPMAKEASHSVLKSMLTKFPHIIHPDAHQNIIESAEINAQHIDNPYNDYSNEKKEIYSLLANRPDLGNSATASMMSSIRKGLVNGHRWLSDPDYNKKLIESLVNHKNDYARNTAQHHIINDEPEMGWDGIRENRHTVLPGSGDRSRKIWKPAHAFLRKMVMESPRVDKHILPSYVASSDDNEFSDFINNRQIDLSNIDNHSLLVRDRNEISAYRPDAKRPKFTEPRNHTSAPPMSPFLQANQRQEPAEDGVLTHKERQDLVINKLLNQSFKRKFKIHDDALTYVANHAGLEHTYNLLDHYKFHLPYETQAAIIRRSTPDNKSNIIEKFLNTQHTTLGHHVQGAIFENGSKDQMEKLTKLPEFLGSKELIRGGYRSKQAEENQSTSSGYRTNSSGEVELTEHSGVTKKRNLKSFLDFV